MKEDLLKLKSSFDTKKDIVNILVEVVRFLIVYLWSKLFHEMIHLRQLIMLKIIKNSYLYFV